MANTDPLSIFVRDALTAGRSRQEIFEVLVEAGWSTAEITKALSAYLDKAFEPPVPRPQMQLTARDAFIYAVMFAALSIAAWAIVDLVHSLIDYGIKDDLDSKYQPKRLERSIRWDISLLVVSMPIFLWISKLTERKIAEDMGHKRSLVRKWLTYFTLFVSALIFLAGTVLTIYNFLSGDLTLRFALKVLTVAVVSGGIFGYYIFNVEDSDAKK